MNKKTRVLMLALASYALIKAQMDEKESLFSPAQMPAQQKKQVAVQKLEYGPGIDTLDVETSGNWLQKRVIWEDAQRKYEKIQVAEHSVLDARVSLFEKRSNSDKTLNVFYSSIGFDQGEIDEIIDTVLAAIEKMKDAQGTLTEQERSIQAKLYEHKNELEQLKADVKSITDLDAALDNAVMQLVNQVTLTSDYERQAWQKFKDIGQELDDRKAKGYYLEMDAVEKNIQAIDSYIRGALTKYFDDVTNKTNELVASIKSKLDILRKSGIDLKNQISELEAAKKEVPKKSATGWFDTISLLWRYPLSLLAQLWNFLTSFIWGTKK